MPSSSADPSSKLPLKPIPGSYGHPFFGAIKDRLDYFYNQGRDEFFATRVQKYHSTIIKTNMPPGPFIAQNPRVIALLDAVSFPVLFDSSKVEKRNVLLELSSLQFPSPEATVTCLSQLFTDIEDKISSQKKAFFNSLSDATSFSFLFRLFCEKDPSSTKIGSKGPTMIDKWIALQLAPLATLNPPSFLKYLDDLLLHTFPFPFFLVKSDYKKLYEAFYEHSAPILDKAESFGIKRVKLATTLCFLHVLTLMQA
ncbi:hypothetical protein GH714_041922 [Hevea brasiliensis]|uniref:Uncharacterized protein n=1 Tax=Hevea brasiliensis TaxID=3981 RepID=A0A6A6MRZ4_HEVBR|nr:hypothetical protein GH714_041922 [Hevea brasiliensis]